MPNFNTSTLKVSNNEVLVVYKPIKNLHLSVMPPDGAVRVSAPLCMTDDEIRQMLALKLPWIRKQQAKYTAQARQTKREFVSGESHYFLGKRYRLEVIYKNEVPKVSFGGSNRMYLQVRPNSSAEKRKEVVENFYREELRTILAGLLDKWQQTLGVTPGSWHIKEMKTKWGTCNPAKKHILFNLALAKKAMPCIEYIVAHELAHLLERTHNDKFKQILDTHIPKWRSIKDELNHFVLDCWENGE